MTFLLDDITIQGYVAGVDDYHWMVVTPEVEVLLLHKGKVVGVYVREQKVVTLDQEACREEIEAIVGPFRQWVLDVQFGQQTSKESK